ncbi:hypothetical protein ACFLQL_01200 [Verrucomicrobiota bacterium]
MNIKSFHIGLAIWIFAVVSVFAESYPNRPSAGELEEIAEQGMVCGNAVRKRGVVANDAGSFLPYCGYGQPYFASLQQKLETLAPIYIDHENGPLTDEEDDFIYFNIDNWRAAAGLNASGFRRSTDGSIFYYGQMQDRDIIGLWILEDIQNGFKALKWTLRDSSLSGHSIYSGILSDADYDSAKSLAEDAYNGATPSDISNRLPFGGNSWSQYMSSYSYDTLLYREYGSVGVTFACDIDRAADLYFLTISIGGNIDVYSTFGDFSATEDKLSVVKSFAESSADSIAFNVGNSNKPTWGMVPSSGQSSTVGYRVTIASFLCKWKFTGE